MTQKYSHFNNGHRVAILTTPTGTRVPVYDLQTGETSRIYTRSRLEIRDFTANSSKIRTEAKKKKNQE